MKNLNIITADMLKEVKVTCRDRKEYSARGETEDP